MELTRIAEAHLRGLSFVRVSDRSTTLFAVPVPSSRGRALLVFAARSRGRGRRWWSPTLALGSRQLRSLAEALKRVPEGGPGAALKSKSGLFIAVRRRSSSCLLLLGSGDKPYATVRLKGSDAIRLSELLEGALAWPPAQLPSPLTWRAKERIFGPHVS